MPKISIAVPYHDTPRTAFFLSRLLQSIDQQSFKDYEIVLTKEGEMAHNHNAAILKSKGEIIQLMQMDDYFYNTLSLEKIVEGFNTSTRKEDYDGWSTQHPAWQITACFHDANGFVNGLHIPTWSDDIYTGNNTLGSISTLSMRRDEALLFEEPLSWVVDCDLYYRMYLKYGLPNLLETPNVVIDTRADRLTHTLSNELKNNEVQYLLSKYVNRDQS